MDNVSQFLQSRKQSLYEKICANKEVAGLLMSFISNLVIMCHRKGTPIEGISFGSPHEYQGEIKAKIKFSSLSIPKIEIWGAKDDFVRYTMQYSKHLYKTLEKNPGVGYFFEKLMDVLELHGERHGLEWNQVCFKKAIITKDDYLVIKLGKETLDKWNR
jgi:hypothetical protein